MPDTDTYECTASATVSGSKPGCVLVCNLPEGHSSDLHWDGQDDITWKEGQPDA